MPMPTRIRDASAVAVASASAENDNDKSGRGKTSCFDASAAAATAAANSTATASAAITTATNSSSLETFVDAVQRNGGVVVPDAVRLVAKEAAEAAKAADNNNDDVDSYQWQQQEEFGASANRGDDGDGGFAQQQQQQPSKEINSLVFQVVVDDDQDDVNAAAATAAAVPPRPYVLAVLDAAHRVDVGALERVLVEADDEEENDPTTFASGSSSSSFRRRRFRLELAPSDRLEEICGFACGRVPPLGLTPEPLLTVVEASLLVAPPPSSLQRGEEGGGGGGNNADGNYIRLLGGGGRSGQSCLIQVRALLGQPNVRVARFRRRTGSGTPDVSSANDNEAEEEGATLRPASAKPYFAVSPPPPDVELRQARSLRPMAFSTVGRLSAVRQIARALVFCDFVPPAALSARDSDVDNIDDDEGGRPWRCGETGEDMSVQLIVGKTFCSKFDDETDAVAALKRLRRGQLVLATGVTNTHNSASLKNWIKKRSLDLVVSTIQVLGEDDQGAAWRPLRRRMTRRVDASDDDSSGFDGDFPSSSSLSPPPSISEPGLSYLSLGELYGTISRSNVDETGDDDEMEILPISKYVNLVDNAASVQDFHRRISELRVRYSADSGATDSGIGAFEQDDVSTRTASPVGLVGIDCEWRPNFLLNDRYDPQPVLLLQVSLHSMKQVFLFDLQTLLRPLLAPSEPTNDLETAVSEALGDLWSSGQLIKVGFQVMHDLRRLAASYPHVPAFQTVHAVLEAKRVGKKIMHMTKQRNSRVASSSLSRLVERCIGKTLNKDQQCSDWSVRPLSPKQVEYAALDAAVTPILIEQLIGQVDARFFDTPQLGRWKDDSSFKEAVTSWRFLFLDTTENTISRAALKKLHALRVVGNPYVVTQTWVSGKDPPRLPSIPSKGGEGPYTDTKGMLRIPAQMTRIRQDVSAFDQLLDAITGERAGRSKERCLSQFLTGKAALPEGSILDFKGRSGYVEFEDAVALFVNAPSTTGRTARPRSYPNEWLENGREMTWFLRENEWKGGTTKLGKKLLLSQSAGEHSVPVVLFVRMEKGHFLCCGRCRTNPAVERECNGNGDDCSQASAAAATPEWQLAQLNLELLAWDRLNSCEDFLNLVNPPELALLDG